MDELGALEKELAPWKPKLDRVEALRRAVRARYDDSPAGEGYSPAGKRFTLWVGPRGKQQTIDLPKLFRAIRSAAFLKICNVTLKRLEAEVSADVIAQVVTSDLTGPRPMKTFERGIAA